MKIKLSTLLLALALIAACICACYPVTGDGGYRTMHVGTGTNAPYRPEDEMTSSPDISSPNTDLPFSELTDVPSAPSDDTTASTPDNTVSTQDTTFDETTAPIPVFPTWEFDIVEQREELGAVGKDKCSCIIRYPALKGLEDTDTQSKLNKLLAQIASVEYQNRLPGVSELIQGGTFVSYEITDTAITFVGNDLISVRSEGRIDYKDDTRNERFVYCNLIRISTAKDITLKKTYTDFASIIALFTSGGFKQISGDTSLSLAQMMEQYKYHAQYGTYPETYFTASDLILVIETNIENGFFAEFSIALSEVNEFLAESPTK